ncbi:MAG: hypothetical protein M1823_001049 [Watsoniomyces obsoletus]|nr:MAG: hypothetical protein M1823_001049 [Watsoniomyces obsoletus]
MAYTDNAVLAKISALNETQESIVTVAQWVMFHKRHAERTVQLWFQRLKDSGANKRLNLIYLANEVAQQSKARRKNDFLIAFSPIITEATAIAYRGATNEVQQKLKRVVEVWRQRQIFETPIQDAIEARVDEVNRSRSSKKPLLGPSLMAGGSSTPTPAELQPLVPLQTGLSRLATGKASVVADANDEYTKLMDPSAQPLPMPVQAARLSGLLRSLATAEGAVAESIKARRALIEGLEKMLERNRASLLGEENEVANLTQRKAIVENKKREVEDGIMRGLADESEGTNGASSSSMMPGHDAPGLHIKTELEEPPVEALTPIGSPRSTIPSIDHQEGPPRPEETGGHVDSGVVADQFLATLSGPLVGNSGAEILSNMVVQQQTAASTTSSTYPAAVPPTAVAVPASVDAYNHPTGVNGASEGTAPKKRKMTHDEDEIAGLGSGDALEGLDEDVAAMLRREAELYQ